MAQNVSQLYVQRCNPRSHSYFADMREGETHRYKDEFDDEPDPLSLLSSVDEVAVAVTESLENVGVIDPNPGNVGDDSVLAILALLRYYRHYTAAKL